MGLSMLEQIALRFEVYASDQEALFRHGGRLKDLEARRVRATVWQDAAKELRSIGADNFEDFRVSVLDKLIETLGQNHAKVAIKLTELFIANTAHKQMADSKFGYRSPADDNPNNDLDLTAPPAPVSPLQKGIDFMRNYSPAPIVGKGALVLSMEMGGQPDHVIVNGVRYDKVNKPGVV